MAQNRAEAALSGKSEILNPTLEHAPDFSWTRQPKATPFTDSDELAQRLGLPPENEGWMKAIAEGVEGPQPTPAAQDFQERLRRVIHEVPELDPRDVAKGQQWGVDRHGNLVLLDYGFTRAMPLGLAGLLGTRDE